MRKQGERVIILVLTTVLMVKDSLTPSGRSGLQHPVLTSSSARRYKVVVKTKEPSDVCMINIVFHLWREVWELNFPFKFLDQCWVFSIVCWCTCWRILNQTIVIFHPLFKTKRFLWHLTRFRSANHIGGLMLVPGTPLIYRWKFIKIYKNASHMWLVLESGLDLTIAPLVIWSVGWIMPLHQIQSTPDMSRTAVKREKKAQEKRRAMEKKKGL